MNQQKPRSSIAPAATAAPALRPAREFAAICLLFFASGFAALVYQVLWMKELGLLFGNTAHAAAATLTAFFLGLAVGGRVVGRRVMGLRHPLRLYAWLEVGVAVTALAYFGLLEIYHGLYPALFGALGEQPALFNAARLTLALVILFPPAFLMGGTLPVVSQQLVPAAEQLGGRVPVVYGINTLGAALGAHAAGFYLPPWLGFDGAYLVAVGITLAVAAGGAWLSRHLEPMVAAAQDTRAQPEPLHLPAWAIAALAFGSGFTALALEVLWTRMFAQVLQNSVYTFSAILTTFLICLALGAWLAAWLARRRTPPRRQITVLLCLAALSVAATPAAFDAVTGGLQYLGEGAGWPGYVLRVFAAVSAVIFLPTLLLGTVFPLLLKVSEPLRLGTGRTVGDLVAWNTLGAIAGSLVAGFVLLDSIGLWPAIAVLAVLYALAAVVLAPGPAPGRPGLRAVAVLALLAAGLGAQLYHPPRARVDPTGGERLLDVLEGSAATVAVVERQYSSGEDGAGKRSLRLKVNNYYSLGGTGAAKWEAWQTHLPLLLHPDPSRVFFLGMGTGITAGAALRHPVEEVITTELLPEVVTAARRYFRDYVNGLFDDSRSRVLVTDGRNYLQANRRRFDVIIADLFLPWRAGAGSLYSREHFATARKRLRPGGLFVQWLPLHQSSRREFGIVARTLVEVFPRVTLWRGDFVSRQPVVALVGHAGTEPLDLQALEARLEAVRADRLGDMPLLHFVPDAERLVRRWPADPGRFLLNYAGNLSAARELLAGYPINTDNFPRVEYGAPITQRREQAEQADFFAGPPLIDFFAEVLGRVPPEQDPYLAQAKPRQRAHVYAGLDLHRLQVLADQGEVAAAREALERFVGRVFR